MPAAVKNKRELAPKKKQNICIRNQAAVKNKKGACSPYMCFFRMIASS